jgi:hypothetical protein
VHLNIQLKGWRLHLQHAQKKDPQILKAKVKMECSSMLHEMYFTHFMLLLTTRSHN